MIGILIVVIAVVVIVGLVFLSLKNQEPDEKKVEKLSQLPINRPGTPEAEAHARRLAMIRGER